MKNKRLLLRTDGGLDMGIGHFMRCLALAQAWRDLGGSAEFAMNTSTPFLRRKAAAEGFTVSQIGAEPGTKEDAEETVRLAQQSTVDWVVVDGYHFGDDYESIVKDIGLHLLSIDDYGHSEHPNADVVVNQNAGAKPDMYRPGNSETRLLVGPRYALLRKEFVLLKKGEDDSPDVRNVLVTLGGGNQKEFMRTVLEALSSPDLGNINTVVAAGTDPQYRDELLPLVSQLDARIRLSNPGESMNDLMNWADIAVSAGGSTCWELAFMGVPFIGIAVAENQKQGLVGAEQEGIAIDLGWYEEVSEETLIRAIMRLRDDPELRWKMGRRGARLVPGTGSFEVAKTMMDMN